MPIARKALPWLAVLVVAGCDAEATNEPSGSPTTGGDSAGEAAPVDEGPGGEPGAAEGELPPCVRAGCSSELCVPEGEAPMTTCEYRREYACFEDATCERQVGGECGFTPTDELERCLADPPVE